MLLITGGAGYIGSHCALRIMELGEDIVIFDNLELGHMETIRTLASLDLPGRLVEFRKGDLKNKADIENLLKQYNFEAVLHFAAYSIIEESVRCPEKYFDNNVGGTLNLLSAMRDSSVDKIVFSSSASVYGEPLYTPIGEEHPLKPINPYGESKLEAEKMMDEFDGLYGIRSIRLRYFNVVGSDSEGRIGECHEPETHLIPNILRSVRSDKIFSIFGTDYPTRNGTCVRDYIDIADLIDAHMNALEYLRNGGKTDFFNLGTNNGSTVREIFSVCEDVVGMSIPLQECDRRPGDPAVLIADNKKAERVLGWKPVHTLEESVSHAWAWENRLR